MISVLPRCPRALWCTKLVFFFPFLFSLFLQLEERTDIMRCITDGFFSAEQVELAPNLSESFSPTLGCVRARTSVHLTFFCSLYIKYVLNRLKPVNQYYCISELHVNKKEHITAIMWLPVFRWWFSWCHEFIHWAGCLPSDTAGQEWELVPRAWCFYCWWCPGISSCRHLFSFHRLHTFQSLQGRKNQQNRINSLAVLLFKSHDFTCDCALTDTWHADLHWELWFNGCLAASLSPRQTQLEGDVWRLWSLHSTGFWRLWQVWSHQQTAHRAVQDNICELVCTC